MSLSPREYLNKHGEAEVDDLCKKVGTTYSYFRVVAYSNGRSRFSGVLARKFHEETQGELDMHQLRPDVFGEGPKPDGKRSRRRAPACP